MKLYRVSYCKHGQHQGYTWHSSNNDAKHEASGFRKEAEGHEAEVEQLEIEPNRSGIVAFLNDRASYPSL